MRFFYFLSGVILLFVVSESKAVLIVNNASYNDATALQQGQAAHLNGVVVIDTERGIGSGFLMKFSEEFKHLNGRIILTAAHVIGDTIRNVYLKGPKPKASKEDEPEFEHPLFSPNNVPSKAHPKFKKNDETTRQYDYGIVILGAPLNHSLLSLSDEPIAKEVAVTIVGYGDKFAINGSNHDEPLSDYQRRAFESMVLPNNMSMLFTQLEPDKPYDYVFPYRGDSGGPVLLKGNTSAFVGIVSGFNDETGQALYTRPTLKDILALVPPELQKKAAAESGAAAKPQTAAAGPGMAVTTAVKPENAAAAGGGGAAMNVGMDDGKSKAANLSAPKPATGGAAAAGGSTASPPMTAKPAQPVVDDATPAAGK